MLAARLAARGFERPQVAQKRMSIFIAVSLLSPFGGDPCSELCTSSGLPDVWRTLSDCQTPEDPRPQRPAKAAHRSPVCSAAGFALRLEWADRKRTWTAERVHFPFGGTQRHAVRYRGLGLLANPGKLADSPRALQRGRNEPRQATTPRGQLPRRDTELLDRPQRAHRCLWTPSSGTGCRDVHAIGGRQSIRGYCLPFCEPREAPPPRRTPLTIRATGQVGKTLSATGYDVGTPDGDWNSCGIRRRVTRVRRQGHPLDENARCHVESMVPDFRRVAGAVL